MNLVLEALSIPAWSLAAGFSSHLGGASYSFSHKIIRNIVMLKIGTSTGWDACQIGFSTSKTM
jgi:hypothetical protein